MRSRLLALAALALILSACAGSGPAAVAALTAGDVEYDQEEIFDFLDLFADNPVLGQLFQAPVGPGSGSATYASDASASALDWLVTQTVLRSELDERGLSVSEEDRREAREEIIHPSIGQALGASALEGRQAFDAMDSEAQDFAISFWAGVLALGRDLEVDDGITDERVREVYDENEIAFTERCVRHLLVQADDPQDPGAALAEAEELLARVEEGEDFGELVAELSADPSAVENDGDLGCARSWAGEFGQQFDVAVFEAEIGEVTGPVGSPAGVHLVEVTDERVLPLDQVRGEIEQGLAAQATGAQIDAAAQLVFERTVELDVSVDPRFGRWQLVVVGPTGNLEPTDDPEEAIRGVVEPPEGPLAPSTTAPAATVPLGG